MPDPKEPANPQLKDLFDRALVAELAQRLHAAHAPLDPDAFQKDATHNLEALELKQRSAQICAALGRHLPAGFEDAVAVLQQAMGPDDGGGGLEGFDGFAFMPFLDFIAAYGLEKPHAALDAMEYMTRYFSAEFAVRPFILRYPDQALPRLLRWTAHPDWRVRRLASEGSRPRLPWGQRLPPFVKDPAPVIDLLDRLYADENLVVRRSVANNLNDIAKDHPDLAADTAKRWWAAGDKDARWTVGHGLRTLIKQGHRGALAVLGFAGGDRIEPHDFCVVPQTVAVGGTVHFSLRLVSRENEAVRLVVDYALHRVLANGKKARKVFKLKQVELRPGEAVDLAGKQTFRQLSTRTYYPGPHAIEILANGRSLGTHAFELTHPTGA